MKIDRALVEKVATLARLDVPAEAADRLVEQLQRIVATVEKLNAVDTKGVEPLTHPTGLVDAFREDEPRPGLKREEVLGNAPDRVDPFFKVPRVVE